MKTSKMLDGYPQRSCGGLPPLPRGATLHRRVNAPLRWPLAAGAARVMAAPASAPAPPLARRGAAYAGAGPSSPRRHPDTLRGRDPRLGCGWTRFPAHFVAGTRSAKVGGVLRGTLPRSCARLRRASGRGARGYSY